MRKVLFQLTPEIIDMIIFGMENQSDEYCVNIKTGDVLSETQADEEYEEVDIDSHLIPVPDWLPSDGFQLMESFVASMHNPVYKESLRNVLSAGRGAFRNFKNTIREHEPLTQQWYIHKEKVLRSRVIEWYNINSEIIKYEDIDENTDETENLILTDFVFKVDCSGWKNIIDEKINESIRESLGHKEEILADYLIGRNKSWLKVPGNTPVFVCAETVDGEFAGCISGGFVKTKIALQPVAVANVIWVEKKFRGMGIARLLIDNFSQNATAERCKKIIFELPGKGSVLNSSLEARGLSAFLTTMTVITENL